MQDNIQQFESLMSKYISETLSDSDAQYLVTLLHSNPEFKIRYNELVKTRAISFLPILTSQKQLNYNKLIQIISNKTIIRPLLPYLLRIAAIVLFVLSTSISTYYIIGDNYDSNNLMSYQTVVPHGSQAKIVLPDGTIAWLNSGSTLKYTNLYGQKNREVEMSGEGYFDVRKNKNKPFVVSVNKLKIKVLGTTFNIHGYNDDETVEVNLIEGKIALTTATDENLKEITLVPNQRVIYNKYNQRMEISQADAARSASWTTGKLCVVDATLEEIAADLERRFDVQIILKSAKIKEEKFSGSLDLSQPIAAILNYLDVDKKYAATSNGKIITITNK